MSDPTLYLYTSLTAGSSHIVTATARLETILKANKLPFRAIDVATDDAARKLWGRRSKGKKLPGLVKFGNVVGDLEEVEEWNEYGELKMQINNVEDFDSLPATSTTSSTPKSETPIESKPTPTESSAPRQSTIKIQNPPANESRKDDLISVALRQASEEAAAKAKENAQAKDKNVLAASEQQTPQSAVSEEKKGEKETVRRKPMALEIAEGRAKRPALAPECAVVSSGNFHADNAEALGLVEHHRGSIVSATSPEEKEKIAQDLRKSVSGIQQDILDPLIKEQTNRAGQEEPDCARDNKQDDTQKRDPKAVGKVTVSVED